VTAWQRGAGDISGFLDRGELETVTPSNDLAARLLADAELKTQSARMIVEIDPGGSLGLAYEGTRKAATALLVVQGLRPTTHGGHRVVQDAAVAQFNGPFRLFGRIRQRRHEQNSPGPDSAPTATADAYEAIKFARDSIVSARAILDTGQATPW
jgi:hypothetical protein